MRCKVLRTPQCCSPSELQPCCALLAPPRIPKPPAPGCVHRLPAFRLPACPGLVIIAILCHSITAITVITAMI